MEVTVTASPPGSHTEDNCHFCRVSLQLAYSPRPYLGFSSDTTAVPSEGHYLLFGNDILEVTDGLPQVHVFDSLCRLSGILKVHPKINSTGLTCWERKPIPRKAISPYLSSLDIHCISI